MKKETRTVVYDDELRLESYRFEGTQQPFPNHFHEYYVIGFVESGERCLSCKNNEYAIQKGNVLLFNPGIKRCYTVQLSRKYPYWRSKKIVGAWFPAN